MIYGALPNFPRESFFLPPNEIENPNRFKIMQLKLLIEDLKCFAVESINIDNDKIISYFIRRKVFNNNKKKY